MKTFILRKNGFTLIEVLVASAIFSIILGALYSTFFLSQRAVASVDDSILRLQESRSVVDLIKREIESAFYLPGRPYTEFKVDDRDLYGRQASRISFTAFSPLLPGLSKITYTAEEEDGNLVLSKKVEPAYSSDSKTESFEMLDNIESFVIETKYRDGWVRTWDSGLTKKIPEEVRIELLLKVGGGDDVTASSDVAKIRIGKKL